MHAALVQRSTANRRKDRRFPLHGAIEMRATGIDVGIHAELEDISGGGCRVMTRVPLQMRHAVRLDLPRPGSGPLRLTGNVVRVYGTSKEKIFHYGIRFRLDTADHRAEITRYVSMYAQRLAPVRHEAAERRESAGGVDVKLPIDAYVEGVGHIPATALALRGDGMRVASDRILRQEWTMKIDLKFPSDVTQGALVTVTARAQPGMREVRGQYVQDITFVEPSLRVRGEIERFLYELRLKETRRRS